MTSASEPRPDPPSTWRRLARGAAHRAAPTVVGLVAAASGLAAQDRLVNLRAVGGGIGVETVGFGGDGLLQPGVAGDTIRVQRAAQVSVPVTFAIPMGRAWTADVSTIWASGSVRYRGVGAGDAGARTVTLSGVGDVRLRLTGRLRGDALIVTVGGTLPSGQQRLEQGELTALRVLAAPAFAFVSQPASGGASATLGVLAARTIRGWSVAGGISAEQRASYTPLSALVTGAALGADVGTADFRPGPVGRLSIGLDGLVGRHRLSVNASGDVFSTDRLTLPSTAAPAPGVDAAPTNITVRLGPIVATDAQLQLAVPRLREAVVWTAVRYRARFSRDGVRITESAGTYVDGGVRAALPVRASADVVLSADGRWHSGLAFDTALPTAGARLGTVAAALALRRGGMTLQPFARIQAGRLDVHALGGGSVVGGGVGLTALARF